MHLWYLFISPSQLGWILAHSSLQNHFKSGSIQRCSAVANVDVLQVSPTIQLLQLLAGFGDLSTLL